MLLVMLVGLPNPTAFTSDTTNYPTPENHQQNKSKSLSHPISPEMAFSAADHTIEGILDPASIEQVGYTTSGNLAARTDVNPEVVYDLPLDDTHGWLGSQAEVDVWNLEKLYATNGTFEEGIPGTNANPSGSVEYYPLGWDANSTDTATYSDDVQLASYDSSGRQYITVESQGAKVGQNAHAHDAGVRIVWMQTVQNAPYTEDFLFSLDYFYLRGPIDGPTGLDEPVGNCSLALFIDGTVVWNMSLLLLTQRGVWFSTGNIPITITGAPSSFKLEIGLVIDEYLELDKRYDYDGDPSNLPDGIGNAAYITVYMDDVSFTKATPPAPSEVELEFKQGSTISSVTGPSGQGSTLIINGSYWNADPVSVQITSNTSVSFEYETRLLSHRFIDSNSRTSTSDIGVNYLVQTDRSPELSFYTYLGSLGSYENFTINVVHPLDWENVTVYDPQSTDVTSQCVFSPGGVTLPTVLFEDRLGWWFFTLESPNYAESLMLELYDLGGDQWNPETIFRSGNRSRVAISIGSGVNIPDPLDLVNITWIMPNGTVWYQESISGGINGDIDSSELEFGPLNTTAGEWQVRILWTNGTEVASSETLFEIHHRASLTPVVSLIETESGMSFWAQVEYKDEENSQIIIGEVPGSYMNANWSASVISFDPNPSQKWWEAPFNTSMLTAGDWVVVVSAHRAYFDDVSCQFTVRLLSVDNTLTINVTSAEVDLGATHVATFTYVDSLGSGIDGADVSVTIDGPAGGISD
ncbi:MAG: hypothetical protein ACFFAZ_16815, partial [Promethearchaeota archaeon]